MIEILISLEDTEKFINEKINSYNICYVINKYIKQKLNPDTIYLVKFYPILDKETRMNVHMLQNYYYSSYSRDIKFNNKTERQLIVIVDYKIYL